MKLLKTLIADYLRLCRKRRLSKPYVAEQTRVLTTMQGWIEKDKIKDVTTYDIYEFLQAEPGGAHKRIKRINIVKGFWNWVCDQYPVKNPTREIITPAYPNLADIVVPNVTTSLVEEMVKHSDPNTGSGHLVKTIWACGLRIEQVLHLAPSDIDDHNMLVFNAPIPDHHTLEEMHLLIAFMVRSSKLDSSHIRRAWNHELRNMVLAAGCEPMNYKELRNACINRWIHEHYPPKSVMKWANIRTTKTLWRHYEAAELEQYRPGPLYINHETTV